MAITKIQIKLAEEKGRLLRAEIGNYNALVRQVRQLMDRKEANQIDMSDTQLDAIMSKYSDIKTQMVALFTDLP